MFDTTAFLQWGSKGKGFKLKSKAVPEVFWAGMAGIAGNTLTALWEIMR